MSTHTCTPAPSNRTQPVHSLHGTGDVHTHTLPLIELNLCIHFMGLETSTHTCTPAPSNRTQPVHSLRGQSTQPVQLSTDLMAMMSSSRVRRGFTHSLPYHNANLMGHHMYSCDGVFMHIMFDTRIYLYYGDVLATTIIIMLTSCMNSLL